MSVDELIEKLRRVSAEGHGAGHLIVEEIGEGYYGDLVDVDTILVGPGGTSVTLLASQAEKKTFRCARCGREDDVSQQRTASDGPVCGRCCGAWS